MKEIFVSIAIASFLASLVCFIQWYRQRNKSLVGIPHRTTWPPEAMRAGKRMNTAIIVAVAAGTILIWIT